METTAGITAVVAAVADFRRLFEMFIGVWWQIDLSASVLRFGRRQSTRGRAAMDLE